MLKILSGGAETTVQDLGRFGYYHIGICPSGAQDAFSFRIGNLLVGNEENAAGLEITIMGPKIQVLRDSVVAFTGAEIPARINGKEAEMWTSVLVKEGDIISYGPIKSGARGYLCIAGGIDVPLKYGSRSTGVINKIGGYNGRKLKEGDELKRGTPAKPIAKLVGRRLNSKYLPKFSKNTILRIVMGLFGYRLTKESYQTFLDSDWKVCPNSNKVGYYYEGPHLKFKERNQPFGAGSDPSNVVDAPYPVGSVQVPGGLNAVLLLNDAVTGGGYATIGTVIKADLDIVAQSKPGDVTRFKEISIQEAIEIRKGREANIKAIKDELEKINL